MENTNQNIESRTKSPRKKGEMIRCPACNALVKSTEIKKHCDLEIDRLIKFQLNGRSCNDRSAIYENGQHGSTSTTNSAESCPWVTYQKVRNNRHSRIKTKSRKRVINHEPICPICNERPNEEINLHVEKCLRLKANQDDGNGSRSGDDSDEDDGSIDIEGETYEEYEWAGQKRIRASTLLQGGYSALGVGSQITNGVNKDEDEDLNVDGDDTQMYGPPQYTESDVILTSREENTDDNGISTYLRNLICGQSTSRNTSTTENGSTDNNETNINVQASQSNIDSSNEADMDYGRSNKNFRIGSGENSAQIIESLKSKIRDYEKQMCNKLKCLICLDDFRNPAISVCCWHVHCEQCWLQTLGARRLCPQCNLITSPSDLRRIYM